MLFCALDRRRAATKSLRRIMPGAEFEDLRQLAAKTSERWRWLSTAASA